VTDGADEHAEEHVVVFVGPRRDVRNWPREREIGVVVGLRGDAYMVTWQWAGGPSAWPAEWLLRVTEEDLHDGGLDEPEGTTPV
jgi:hypothetical protein